MSDQNLENAALESAVKIDGSIGLYDWSHLKQN